MHTLLTHMESHSSNYYIRVGAICEAPTSRVTSSTQVEQLKDDLANDEKIFAEQQVEFDTTKQAMGERIKQYQEEVCWEFE